MKHFTEKAERILQAALETARALGHTYVGSEHLLLSIAEERDCAAARLLDSHGLEPLRLREIVEDTFGTGNRSQVGSSDMTPRLCHAIEVAAESAERGGAPFIGSEHLLYALLAEDGAVAGKLLSALGISCTDLQSDLSALLLLGKSTETKSPSKKSGSPLASLPALSQYGRDLVALAREGRIDPVIGRERESQRLMQVLCRRQKNNPCLLGEPGVGKTAVVEGLALRIAEGDVPSPLRDKIPVALDLGAMIAGAKYRGEFEERLKKLMAETVAHPEIILFIDEVHTIVGAGAAEGAVDAANIMKPALSRGEIQVIGATTLTEYRRHIEKDAALERRFQPIEVTEPSEEEALDILRGLCERYERHHGLQIREDALQAAVRLSARYLPDRFLPDKAIDLLDESAARLHIAAETMPDELNLLCRRLQETARAKEECIRRQDFEAAAAYRDRERKLREEREEKQNAWRAAAHAPQVGADDIARTLTLWTGIPAERITENESDRLSRLPDLLRKRVIGQDEAIERLCYAIRRSRLGLQDPRRPVGSFLFLGPTGVGKTELALALGEALFGDRKALIRLDMSEYMEKQSAAKLIGAPPGYIGYDEGGILTEAVRRRPYAVVLFDEIEEAHPDVYNLLLQILDDGSLTDSQGRRADFRNTVILMTSNAIGRVAATPGFAPDGEVSHREPRHALTSIFRPEFLNRIDDILYFRPLDRQACTAIAKRLLEECRERAMHAGIDLSVGEGVDAALAEAAYDTAYGARPLRREIIRTVQDRLSDLMLSGRIHPGDRVFLVLRDRKPVFLTSDDAPVPEHAPLA